MTTSSQSVRRHIVAATWHRLAPGMLRLPVAKKHPIEPPGLADLTLAWSSELSLGEATFVEAERRRIARDLHDVVGQALAAVQLCASATRRLTSDPAVAAELGDMVTTVQQALQEIRTFGVSLRADVPNELNLAAGLALHVEREGRRGGLRTSFSSDGIPGRLTPAIERAAFRIAQEAITNVIAHSGAVQLTVHLGVRGRALLLRIADNGCGFNPRVAGRADRRLGLVGMRERAALAGGSLMLHSGHRGTLIRATLPLATIPAVGLNG
jgi:signal transduction histidine kinase